MPRTRTGTLLSRTPRQPPHYWLGPRHAHGAHRPRPAGQQSAPPLPIETLAPPPVRQPTPTPTRACLPPCMIPEMKRKPAAGRPRPAKTTVCARVQSRDVPASLRAPTPSCPVASPARLSRAAMLSPNHPAPAQATKLARAALSIYPAIYRVSRLSTRVSITTAPAAHSYKTRASQT
jgi:hypothetical protein